ncbi:MAG: hypothetical protein BWY85_00514 [Firmicutes bacterium ADurb.Bin506]|nr:MAG: hypothetical protein BWY85_00514 [Firmicutes bacterium ADurb.Bin506]
MYTVTVYEDVRLANDQPVWVGIIPGRAKCLDEAGSLIGPAS